MKTLARSASYCLLVLLLSQKTYQLQIIDANVKLEFANEMRYENRIHIYWCVVSTDAHSDINLSNFPLNAVSNGSVPSYARFRYMNHYTQRQTIFSSYFHQENSIIVPEERGVTSNCFFSAVNGTINDSVTVVLFAYNRIDGIQIDGRIIIRIVYLFT